MKREMIYRTDAMAAVGNLKWLSDTDKSKAMQAMLDVPAVQTCDDAVSRAAAIAAVSNWLYDRDDGRSVDQLLSTLPSVQPETHDKRTETHACDLISRQAAIDAVLSLSVGHRVSWKDAVIDILDELPSAEPEHTMEEFMYGQDMGNPEDGSL